MEKWLTMSMADLGRGIAAGEIDPIDLTEKYLSAIKAHPFGTRIYARLTEERARAEAKAASERAKAGLRRGLLDGVPVSWKDLFDTAGTATEAGSALLKDRVPDSDAWVLQNATKAGLVCLGKTHMSELAFSGLGLNPVTETPPLCKRSCRCCRRLFLWCGSLCRLCSGALWYWLRYGRICAYPCGMERSRRPQNHSHPHPPDRRCSALRKV